jgi:DNA-binding transcriptional regulator YiaG
VESGRLDELEAALIRRFWPRLNSRRVSIEKTHSCQTLDKEELKRRREGLGITQGELAREFGVDVMTISRWERGTRSIPPYLELALQTVERRYKARLRSTDSNGNTLNESTNHLL